MNALFEIAMAKVWANGLVILVAVTASLVFVVRGILGVPIAGSPIRFLAGVVLYLFFATALGVFLGTITQTMAQFALLIILLIIVFQMLSGGNTPHRKPTRVAATMHSLSAVAPLCQLFASDYLSRRRPGDGMAQVPSRIRDGSALL